MATLLFKDESRESKISESFDAFEFTLFMIILWPVTIPFLLIGALSEKL